MNDAYFKKGYFESELLNELARAVVCKGYSLVRITPWARGRRTLVYTMGMSGRQISLGCIAIALMVATWEVMAKLLQSSDLNNTRP